MKIGSLFLPLFVAACFCAQTTPAPAHHRQPMLQKLTAELNLTADQQAQAKAIFQKSWEQRKALAPKLREERVAMFNAVKTDDEQQIDQVVQQNSRLNARRVKSTPRRWPSSMRF